MSWKDWSYWLKGGIIVMIIGSIIFLLAGIMSPTCKLGADCPINLLSYISSILVFPILFLIEKINSIGDNLLILIIPVYFFIIGSIIGLIYGKIKSKKNKRK